MGADRKPVCLVAHALDEVEHRIARRQGEVRLALHEEALATCIAVDTLGDANRNHAFGDIQFVEDLAHRRHLALTTVDEDHIRPGGEAGIRAVLRSHTAIRLSSSFNRRVKRRVITSRIMPKSSPGVMSVDLMLNLRYWPFDETFRPRDHHPADGIGTHDVGVVVDLDAARHLGQLKGLGKSRQQARLRGSLGELPPMRLAGIGIHVIDEILLFPALRHADRNLVAGLYRQRSGQQILQLHGTADSRMSRGDGFVVIKLGEEGVEHFRCAELRICLGEIGLVAPVLAGPEEEDLDAGKPALVMDREDIGFLDASRVDALVALDVAKPGKTIAIDGGALEIEVFGSGIHGLGHVLP